jgi:hypothetical protein
MYYTTDQNLVNESVYFIREMIPYQVKTIGYLFKKYGQHVKKTISTLNEYKMGLENDNLAKIINLPFSELLLICDKDKLMELNTEINGIPSVPDDLYKIFTNEKTKYPSLITEFYNRSNRDNLIEKTTGNVKVGKIVYKYMKSPTLQIKKLIRGNYSYEINNSIPLIKVVPKISFDSYRQYKNPNTDYPFEKDVYQNIGSDLQTTSDTNVFGVGLDKGVVDVKIVIDLEGLFSIFTNLLYLLSNKDDSCNEETNQYRSSDDIIDSNIKYFLSILSQLDDDDYFDNCFIPYVIDNLSKRITYSAVITFLATVTKIEGTTRDFFTFIADNILDIGKDNLLDENFYASEIKIKRGSLLRVLSTNISSLMTALFLENKDDMNNGYRYNNSKKYAFFKNLINNLYALKYSTFNYLKIPVDNEKFKSLNHIGEVAKKSIYLLDTDNKLAIKCIYEGGVKDKRSITSFFNGFDSIRVDANYPMTKRCYTLGLALLQQVSFLTIIRYRLGELGEYDEYKTDALGRNTQDYREYLNKNFINLKRSVKDIYSRIESIYSYNSYIEGNGRNENSIRYLCEILYGLSNESKLFESDIGSDILSRSDNPYEDKQIHKNEKKCCDYTFREIGEAAKQLLTKQLSQVESNYIPLKGITNNCLTQLWAKISGEFTHLLDLPFSHHLIESSGPLEEIAKGYAVDSYYNTSPNIDNKDLFNREKEYSYFFENETINNANKYLNDNITHYSLEDLREEFNKIKEKGKEDMFGMFQDFGGYDMAVNLNAAKDINTEIKEGVIPPDDIDNIEAGTEELDKLIDEFDNWLGDNY